VPSTAAFDIAAQKSSNAPMFMPGESLVPPDDILMKVDLQTPFATMTDFMTDGPNVQFDLNDAWWMSTDLTVPNAAGP